MYTVEIMANGKWVKDGKNHDIPREKAIARLNRLNQDGRSARVVNRALAPVAENTMAGAKYKLEHYFAVADSMEDSVWA